MKKKFVKLIFVFFPAMVVSTASNQALAQLSQNLSPAIVSAQGGFDQNENMTLEWKFR